MQRVTTDRTEESMNAQVNPRFYHFLAEGNIICGTKASSSREVIAELSRLLAHNTAGFDAQAIAEDVMLREKLMPTVIASGLAVPHARMTCVDRLTVAMATSEKGIDFGFPGMPSVKVVVLMLTPADDPGLHLQVLAALARDFGNPKVVDEVAALANPHSVMNYFNASSVEIPQFLRARDVMDRSPVTLLENNTLGEAIEVFATTKNDEIPVIDDERFLRGVVSLSDLLKFSLPEHLLWLDDLSSVYRFQPFSEVLQTADETKVADFMREEFITVEEDIPAVQLTKLFLMNKLQKLIVASPDGTLAGVVDLKAFAARLFWE